MAKNKGKGSRYPRTLYRKDDDGAFRFANKKHRINYDSLLVENQDEQDEAERAGWVDGFSDALFGEPKVAPDVVDEEY